VDNLMSAELDRFKEVSRMQREKKREENVFTEPLRCANTSNNAARCTSVKGYNNTRVGPHLLKLTEVEQQLLFDNEGCLKCW
jgi:hypothetical protein